MMPPSNCLLPPARDSFLKLFAQLFAEKGDADDKEDGTANLAEDAVDKEEAPVEEESHAYEPSSPRRNLKIPTDPTSSDVAAAMLKLLQDQSYSRQSRKQRLYNSWFQ